MNKYIFLPCEVGINSWAPWMPWTNCPEAKINWGIGAGWGDCIKWLGGGNEGAGGGWALKGVMLFGGWSHGILFGWDRGVAAKKIAH